MKRDAKKDLIADAALSCFLASGYSGTPVDNIVKASGISKGGLYWHFKSKEELFLYLVEKWLDENKRAFETRLNASDPATAKLYKFVDFTVEKAQSPVHSLIHEFVMTVRKESVIKHLRDLMNNYSAENILTSIINQGIESGEFRPLNARTASEILVTMLEGLTMKWYFRQKDISLLRRTVKTAINIYLEGLLTK